MIYYNQRTFFLAGYIEYGDDYHQSTRIECRECEGTGFNKILKKYKIKGASIFDVWKMTLDEAVEFFKDTDKSISETCASASEIMLGHLHVGQATATLSGLCFLAYNSDILFEISSTVATQEFLFPSKGSFYKAATKIIALGEKGGSAGGKLIDVDEFLKKQRGIIKIKPLKPETQIEVELNSSIYKYNGAKVSFAENRMNLITGYSGVGKSTLLREYLPQVA